jgi:hypothetical protein
MHHCMEVLPTIKGNRHLLLVVWPPLKLGWHAPPPWICDGISHDACILSQNRTSVMGGRIVAWSPFLVLLVVQFTPAWTVVAGYHRRFQQTWKKTLSTCSFRLLALPLTWHWGNLVPYQCIMPGNNTPLDFGLSPVSVYRWVGGGKFDWVSIHNTNLPNRCVNK